MAGKKKSRRNLTAAERALWDQVIARATPIMRPARTTGPETDLPRQKGQAARPLTPAPIARDIAQFRIGDKTPVHRPAVDLAPDLDETLARSAPNMDRRRFERMKKGKMAIDARIDLHGMTQARAQAALGLFVRDSHSAGKRLLLVITGKGRDKGDDDIIPARRGVLKHQVPRWLSQPPLAALVLQVSPAHRRHGGSGAYYVYLRRRRTR